MIRRRHSHHFLRLGLPPVLSFSSSQLHLSNAGDAARTVADLIVSQPTAAFSSSSSYLPSLVSSLCASSLLLVLSDLRRRRSPPSASLDLFRLAVRLRLPSLDHRHSSFVLHLLLRRCGPTPALDFLLSLQNSPPSLLHDKLFNPLLRSLSPHRSLSLFRLMGSPQFGVSPSTVTYNSLLSVLLCRGQTHNARELFEEMLRSRGAPPDAYTFNTLIRGFCVNGLLDEAFGFFSQMQRWCSPDVVTYNTLLDGLCRSGKLDTARNFLNGMKRKGGKDVAPNVVSYTTMIRGHCGCGDVEKAVKVLDEMVEFGLKPNRVTYNTLVKGLCEARRMDLVKEVLEHGDDGVGFKPDTCTFNTLMAAHCESGRMEDAVKVFQQMLDLRVKTDSASYSTLIRGFCERGEFRRAEELMDELLEKGVLRRRGVCIPLVAAYNPIFEYLCQDGKAKKAGSLMRELLERKATMDVAAFNTVILGYCNEGEFREGYGLLVLMVKRNLNPDSEVFGALINGFLTKEDISFAWKTLERMLNCGHRPSTSIFHSVLAGLLQKDGLAEEAGNLVAVMVERKVRHNIDLSTNVVASLLGVGFNHRAFEIAGLLYDNGYCLKMVKLVELVCQDKKYLEARDLLLFSLKRNENLDARIYGRVITCLCANGKASDAFELFYGMTEKGIECTSSSCLNDLRNALETTRRLQEADFVSKQMNRLKTVPHMLLSTDTDMGIRR